MGLVISELGFLSVVRLVGAVVKVVRRYTNFVVVGSARDAC